MNPTLRFLLPFAADSSSRGWVQKLSQDGGVDHAGGMLSDARLTLKFWLTFALGARSIGLVMTPIAPVAALGKLLVKFGDYAMIKLRQEWVVLDSLERIARALVPLRQAFVQVLPWVARYSESVVRQTPQAVRATLKAVEEAHGVRAALYPALPSLPVEKEKEPGRGGQLPTSGDRTLDVPAPVRRLYDLLTTANDVIRKLNSIVEIIPETHLPQLPDPPPWEKEFDDENPSLKRLEQFRADYDTERTTQWVRATYPWVEAWRSSLRTAMKLTLTFSLSSGWYRNWTNRYTLAWAYRFRSGRYLPETDPRGGKQPQQKKLAMYVLKGMDPLKKGYEPWADRPAQGGNEKAEELFSLVAFVQQPDPRVIAPGFFRQARSGGTVTFAQALLYNAGSQKRSPYSPFAQYQPEVGWDTLNWAAPPSQSMAFEHGFGDEPRLWDEFRNAWPPTLPFVEGRSDKVPGIRLDWQAKLIPVTTTRLRPAVFHPLTHAQLPSEARESVLRLAVGGDFLINH
jgi:hypothetical protein